MDRAWQKLLLNTSLQTYVYDGLCVHISPPWNVWDELEKIYFPGKTELQEKII
jgi:hypothetical protein